MRTREQTKLLLEVEKVYFEAFFNICPFTLSHLRTKNVKQPLVNYRQVGCLWLWLTGETLEKTAKYFNRTHAAVVAAIEQVLTLKDTIYGEMLDLLLEENSKLIAEDSKIFLGEVGEAISKKQKLLAAKIANLETTLKYFNNEFEKIKKEYEILHI